jgi:Cu/Ag efflux pump CusA
VLRRLESSSLCDSTSRVKPKLDELKPTLPPGLEVVTTYDRSELIDRSIENLKGTLIEELTLHSKWDKQDKK